MVAVGEVVMNRVASPSFPNTIAEVLEQPGQFTPYASQLCRMHLQMASTLPAMQRLRILERGRRPTLYFNTHSGTTKLGAHYFS